MLPRPGVDGVPRPGVVGVADARPGVDGADGDDVDFTLDFLSDDGEDAGNDEDGVVGAYPTDECDARSKLLSVTNSNKAQ